MVHFARPNYGRMGPHGVAIPAIAQLWVQVAAAGRAVEHSPMKWQNMAEFNKIRVDNVDVHRS